MPFPTSVVFLDVDGVLLSHRSLMGLGGWPSGANVSPKSVRLFDPVALGMLRAFAKATGASFVLSSTWRIMVDWRDFGTALDLPMVGATDRLLSANRGEECAAWLADNPGVTDWAIIDDDSDMLDAQLPRFVHVSGLEGFVWSDFVRLCLVFGIDPFACLPHRPAT